MMNKDMADNTVHMIELSRDKVFSSIDSPYDQRLQNYFFQHLIRDNNLGIILLDQQGSILEISRLACDVLGLQKDQVLGCKMEQAFPGLPFEQMIVDPSLLAGVTFKDKPLTWTNNNQRYQLVVDSNVIRDEQGKMLGAYVIFKNITHLRSLDQKIERNDRLALIGQIAAGAAHEIRNPLTSIQGFLQLLQRDLKSSGKDKEASFTDIMLSEVHRINALVSEFLLLSKPRNTQYELVDLEEVIQQILPIIRSEGLLHGIDVIYENDKSLPMVIGSSELLKQVFLNICKNGIEAMDEGGMITIKERDLPDGRFSIDIHDTGAGIPCYILDKIFDPFFTTKEEGTGLGLPICQKIIHDIGGQIQVSSKGFGTTFHIILNGI
jgi:two-component system, sporulation sensor kinase E